MGHCHGCLLVAIEDAARQAISPVAQQRSPRGTYPTRPSTNRPSVGRRLTSVKPWFKVASRYLFENDNGGEACQTVGRRLIRFGCFAGRFSGDVSQRITAPWFSPSLTVNYAGDPKIEDRVVTEVAGYGRRLGWLTEIALALANEQPPP